MKLFCFQVFGSDTASFRIHLLVLERSLMSVY